MAPAAKAVTATARKIAVLFYTALRHGMDYANPGVSYYEELYRKRVIDNLHRCANRGWLDDITCISTGEGWLYLAAMLDLATRKVVGWSMRDHMRTELTLGALIMAAHRQRPSPGLTHHSAAVNMLPRRMPDSLLRWVPSRR